MEGQTSNDKRSQPLINEDEAKELAIGIARLVEATGEPPKKTLVDSEELARQVDPDFTCFLCRKRCRTKSRFLTHFRSHFKAAQIGRKKRRSNDVVSSDVTTDDDDDGDDDSDASTGDDGQEPVHLRGVECDESQQKSSFHHRRRRKISKSGKRSGFSADPDADSGCHSIDEGSSSYSALSDCPGDSESSDSDAEENSASRSKQQTKKKRAMSITAKDRLSLAEKQLDNNETEGLICLTCLKRFSNCQNLRRHLRLHIARDSVTPDIEKTGSATHCDDDDDFDGRYFCDWCPARFDNRSAARVHENTHKGQATKCYVCDKSYADRYSLRYHLRTHGIGRQIRCEYCNKSFSKPSRLEAHVRAQHDNIRDFDCLQCGKKFKTRVHLRNHLTRHSGERPFACDVCSDRFRHKASLVAHMRSHEGSRPYCCETCGKTFREPSTLKAHCRVHTGDKPYRCNLCDKSFTQRAGLNYHKKSHVVQGSGTLNTMMPTPLPSPPVQSGDAMFQMSPLPSFDHLKSSSPSSSPSSTSSSSMSSCSSDAFSYTLDKPVTSSGLHRDVTPPQTPPSMTTSPPMSTTASMSNPYSLPAIDEEDEDDLLPALNISEISHQFGYSGTEQCYYNKAYGQDQSGALQGYRQPMCHQHHQQLLQHPHQQWFQTAYHIPHHEMQQQPQQPQQQQQQPSASPYTSGSYDYSSHGYDFSNPTSGFPLINHGMQQQQQQHHQLHQHQHQAMDHFSPYQGNGYGVAYDHQAALTGSGTHHHQANAADGYCL